LRARRRKGSLEKGRHLKQKKKIKEACKKREPLSRLLSELCGDVTFPSHFSIVENIRYHRPMIHGKGCQ